MRRRDIAKGLVVATGPVLLAQKATAQTCTAPCYARTAAEIAAGVTPTNTAFLPGDIRRYGASVSNADNGLAINNALKCNPIVFDGETSGPVIYKVQTTIQFRAAGQAIRGAGSGELLGDGASRPSDRRQRTCESRHRL